MLQLQSTVGGLKAELEEQRKGHQEKTASLEDSIRTRITQLEDENRAKVQQILEKAEQSVAELQKQVSIKRLSWHSEPHLQVTHVIMAL